MAEALSNAVASLAGRIQHVNVVWVEAEAVITVRVAVGVSTAVAIVPIAAAVVVVIIAETVTNKFGSTAVTVASRVMVVVGYVEAKALRAKSVMILVTTAVATVPVASADVVVIVTVAIAKKIGTATLTRAIQYAAESGILALAVSAVDVVVLRAAAVATVPVTVALVVVIVAKAVSLVILLGTGADAKESAFLAPVRSRQGGRRSDLNRGAGVRSVVHRRCWCRLGQSRAVVRQVRGRGGENVVLIRVSVGGTSRGGRRGRRDCPAGHQRWRGDARVSDSRRGSHVTSLVRRGNGSFIAAATTTRATAAGTAAHSGRGEVGRVGNSLGDGVLARATRAVAAVHDVEAVTRHCEHGHKLIASARGVADHRVSACAC